MSGPSVWNGRNEGILGPSNNSNTSINTLPTSNVGQSSSKISTKTPNETNNNSSDKAVPAPAPVPTKSVWNGNHANIKAMAIPAPSSNFGSAASPSLAEIAVSDGASKPKNVNVATKKKKGSIQNPKSNNKVVLPSTIAKETSPPLDEGTNSTAGSSTTNTIEEETDANNRSSRSVGSDVVVNVQDVASSPSNSSSLGGDSVKANDNKASDIEKTIDAPPVATVGEKKKKERSASSGNMSAKSGQKKGGKQNNNNSNSHNTQQNGQRSGNHKQRGNKSNGQNGRRKAGNDLSSIHNADKPICAFYVRGMCNRGTACAFKHDPSAAPAPPSGNGFQANKQMLRHGSNGGPNQISPSSMPFNRLGSGRTFDPVKAKAIQLAKDAQDKEDRSAFASPSSTHPELQKEPTSITEPPFFSIDVECIATGYGSCAKGINDGCGNLGKNVGGVPPNQYNELSHRYPGRVAMVDTNGNLLADIIIRPPQDGKGVVSYLTALTGLTREICLGPEAKSLEEAVSMIKSLLPKDAVLVGQAIDHDVEWLGLVPGEDFERMVDLSVVFRQRMPAVLGIASDALRSAAESGSVIGSKDAHPSTDEYLGFDTRYRSFSLRHVCINLLGTDIQSGVHDPVVDARYSLTLFHKYRNSSITQLRIVRDGLHRAPVTPGFAAEKTPVLDGVCVSAAGYPYKQAARKIWRWYSGKKEQPASQSS